MVELGNSNTVQQGDSVVLVGNPLGLEASITAGIISGLRKMEDGYQVFQTDAAANPGNSGGPMLNASGAAVGVLTFKLQGTENLNFVVPINYARGLVSGQESMSVGDLQARLGKTTDLFDKKIHSFPQQWWSFRGGITRILRLEGDHLYVETVLTDDHQKLGDYVFADLKKAGERYVGWVESKMTCRYFGYTDYIYNTCEDVHQIEITVLTPT